MHQACPKKYSVIPSENFSSEINHYAQVLRGLLSRRVEYYKSANDAEWAKLHEMLRTISNWPKLCISILEESSITQEPDVLNNYPTKQRFVCLLTSKGIVMI